MTRQNQQHHWILRTNPFVHALILLALIGSVCFIVCLERYKSSARMLLRNDRVNAGFLALLLKEHIDHLSNTLESYASRPLLMEGARKKDAASIARHLNSLISNEPDIERVIVADKDANVLASYPRLTRVLPASYPMNCSVTIWLTGSGIRDVKKPIARTSPTRYSAWSTRRI
ncbi:MAG TPA: hypothetical protein HPP94_01290 [Desulfuromonadales bacterium]|nr:hypothetical protein [Desulfuromonadales bacterium]